MAFHRSERRNRCPTGLYPPSSSSATHQGENMSALSLSETQNIDPDLQTVHSIKRRRGRHPKVPDPTGTQNRCPFEIRGCTQIYVNGQTRKNHLNVKKNSPDTNHPEDDELWLDPDVIDMYKVFLVSQYSVFKFKVFKEKEVPQKPNRGL
jgi:hypothetical protein